MRVAYSWLREYVDCELPPEELAEKLTMVGLAVEGIFAPVEGLDQIIVGKILDVKPHPNADHLSLCSVDTGSVVVQLVSGAPNLKVGACAAVALPGVVLPSGKVETRKFRGVLSEGMLCSGAELGTDEWGFGDDKGILLLSGDIPPGTRLDQALKLDDCILEFELTPNRGDCQSVINIAREVKGIIPGAKLHLPQITVKECEEKTTDLIRVRIQSPDLCRRYACRVVRNIKLGPSPSWMQYRLLAAGMRPINNIVDVTNYVMLEYGQPLHAFDYDMLKGKQINVRRAKPGEKIVSLDGTERELDEEMLVIADQEEAVAIAGVMGGLASEVTEKTKTVVLESALFDPYSVRRTAMKLGMRTEASARFEKGINPEGVIPALNRAAQLIQQLGAGEVTADLIDNYVRPEAQRTIRLRTSRVNKVLGTELSRAEVQEILSRLDFPCELCGQDSILVTVPPYRVDISEEVDLIEEVARLYGYDQIPTTYPVGTLVQDQEYSNSLKDLVTDTVCSFGLDEVVTFSFIGENAFDKLRIPQDSPLRNILRIKNPLGEEQGVMRTMLLPGLMEVLTYNYHRKLTDLGLFEVGKVFIPNGEGKTPDERLHLGLIACGKVDSGWQAKDAERDFYYLKGIVEGILEILRIEGVQFQRYADSPTLHPGRSAQIFCEGELLGYLGELHPDLLANYEIKTRVVYCELDIDKVMQFSNWNLIAQPIPRYPGVSRDMALLVPDSVSAAQVLELIYRGGGDLLKEARLFDVYCGDQVPAGYRSLAYSLLYQSPERTLTDEEVAETHSRIIKLLEKEVGARLR